MLLADAEAQGLGEPVGVLAFEGLLESLVVQGQASDRFEGVTVDIVALAPLHVQFLQGVAEVVARQVRRLDGKGAVVGDAAFVVGERLGLDYDDAVGTLGAVDGLGGGVLEDRDALDAVHVHVGHLFQRGLEAVEDEQRLVGLGEEVALEVGSLSRERGSAAKLHRGHHIGVGTGLQVVKDHQGRIQVLERLHHIAVGYPLDVIAGH